MSVVVVGAQPGSLGARIAYDLRAHAETVTTWGISEHEDKFVDLVVMSVAGLRSALVHAQPQHIICTVGMNTPEQAWGLEDPTDWYAGHMQVNCIGPMKLLAAWQDILREQPMDPDAGVHHYVVIGSNSARVPRQGSAAYSASKAALAQALRCKAREMAGGDALGLVAYGYEPGLLAGTPMTAQTARDYPGVPLTRMRGSRLSAGVGVGELARLVVTGLGTGAALNGCMVPFDAGEV